MRPYTRFHPRLDARRDRRRAVLATVATLAAATAPAAPAATRAETASFSAELRASQVETWSFAQPDDAGDPCDAPSAGGGSQRFTLRTRKLRVNALRLPGERPIVSGARGALRVDATLDREGDYRVQYEAVAPDCVGYGDDAGGVPAPRDCGGRSGPVDLDIAFPRRGVLELGAGAALEEGFVDCPFWVGSSEPEGTGELGARRVKLPEAHLFDRGRRRIVVHMGVTKCFDDGGLAGCDLETGRFRGRITTTYKLTLTRLRASAGGR